jgi:hypothetical protein
VRIAQRRTAVDHSHVKRFLNEDGGQRGSP